MTWLILDKFHQILMVPLLSLGASILLGHSVLQTHFLVISAIDIGRTPRSKIVRLTMHSSDQNVNTV